MHVELHDLELPFAAQHEEKLECTGSHGGSERLITVNLVALSVASCGEPGLALLEAPIRILFIFKCHEMVDEIGAIVRDLNYITCIVLTEVVMLILNRIAPLLPIWTGHRIFVGLRSVMLIV